MVENMDTHNLRQTTRRVIDMAYNTTGDRYNRQWRQIDEWYRERPDDYLARTNHIIQHGLPSEIQWQEWGDRDPNNPLYVIRVKPAEGFTHLHREELQEEMQRRAPYHVSIGFRNDYNNPNDPWFDWYQQRLTWLRDEYREWRAHTFKIQDFGNATANLRHDDTVYVDLFPIYANGAYGAAQMHISM